ncbi:DUF3696 domain-containing protein [Hydrogenophaga crocea]|uniref:DUF3696 domain-containing protein n=1 Tax=Hydrogenophaga crocea TaxID=2716225 RepID=A0A6G8IFV1_9BURK|nr:DUF3696 domain-containing protein [Hydrogenophaga crocea]QIM52023.1 DUF3696 domain-containing protein [Hydrogenophaga crocea]
MRLFGRRTHSSDPDYARGSIERAQDFVEKAVATVDAIRIQNLRSLTDTGWLEQRPITVLVGKNSAGKSTFARTFPLLRQSTGVKRRSPLLWFGELVDFGQFSTAVNNNDLNKRIVFSFRTSFTPLELEEDYYFFGFPHSRKDRTPTRPVQLDIAINLKPGKEDDATDTVAESLEIECEKIKVRLEFEDASSIARILLDNKEVWRKRAGESGAALFDSIMPDLNFFKERLEPSGDEQEHSVFLEDLNPFSGLLIGEIKRHLHGNLKEERVRQIASRLSFGDDEYFLQSAVNAGGGNKRWLEYIQSCRINSGVMQPLKRYTFLAKFPIVLSAANQVLSGLFSQTRYVEPLRATAQRYYRKQDLAIDELDSKGGNVAHFLHGLPYWKKQRFDNFSERLFGFKVHTHIQGGHIELQLAQASDQHIVNLADAGVGFSQMLPIIIQVWAANDEDHGGKYGRYGRATYSTLVIEQPELHLHPAYQAAVADLLCEVVSPTDRAVGRRGKVVVETHSPALVNRLGALVSSGRLKSEDVQVLLFEQDKNGRTTTISKSTFDDEGVLLNWPFGFFEPEV